MLALIPTAAPAQPEPVILHCKEVKAEGADPERFFIHLDVDEKVVRFHRRDLPPMKMLMVESWRIEFADHEKSPTLLGTINQITGYMPITFQDGEAMISGEASDGDEVAQQIISEIEEALLNPSCASDNEEDEIGRCAGHA